MNAINLAENCLLNDFLIRHGIRQLCKKRLKEELANHPEKQQLRFQKLIEELRESPIAIETAAANEQHYEVPALFYQLSLGKNLKYSGCNWPDHIKSVSYTHLTLPTICSV